VWTRQLDCPDDHGHRDVTRKEKRFATSFLETRESQLVARLTNLLRMAHTRGLVAKDLLQRLVPCSVYTMGLVAGASPLKGLHVGTVHLKVWVFFICKFDTVFHSGVLYCWCRSEKQLFNNRPNTNTNTGFTLQANWHFHLVAKTCPMTSSPPHPSCSIENVDRHTRVSRKPVSRNQERTRTKDTDKGHGPCLGSNEKFIRITILSYKNIFNI